MVNLGMSKYIASEYLENIVDYYLGHSNGAEHYAYGVMRGELRVAPAADVVEVKHGYWIRHYDNLFPAESTQECSVCHEHEDMLLCNENYCPNCGSKMDQEET